MDGKISRRGWLVGLASALFSGWLAPRLPASATSAAPVPVSTPLADPMPAPVTVIYDCCGGKVTTYTYSADNQMLTVAAGTGRTWTYTDDGRGSLT